MPNIMNKMQAANTVKLLSVKSTDMSVVNSTLITETKNSATADGPRDALSVKILSTAEASCTTNHSNGVRGLQLTDW